MSDAIERIHRVVKRLMSLDREAGIVGEAFDAAYQRWLVDHSADLAEFSKDEIRDARFVLELVDAYHD